MLASFNQFQANIEEVKKIELLALNFQPMTPVVIDTSTILRSCIVLSVSALDHFVHEITIAGMKDVFIGVRPATPRYLRFNVSLDFVTSIGSSTPVFAFESELRKVLGWQTFQRPNKIKEAISLFTPIPLWSEVATVWSDSEANIKNQLNLIVERRNMISHEADIEPIYKTKRPIRNTDVSTTITFIEKLGTIIFGLVR